jgi:hypothetical protein
VPNPTFQEEFARAERLFAELRAQPGDPFSQIAVSLRNRVPAEVFHRLGRSQGGFVTASRDLAVLREVGRVDLVTLWCDLATPLIKVPAWALVPGQPG